MTTTRRTFVEIVGAAAAAATAAPPAGAGSAGLRTFWIQRSTAAPPEEIGFPAAHVVRAITELPALVRR